MTTPGGGLLGCDVACFATRGPSGNATSTTTDPVVASPCLGADDTCLPVFVEQGGLRTWPQFNNSLSHVINIHAFPCRETATGANVHLHHEDGGGGGPDDFSRAVKYCPLALCG